jgi:4-hydroxy-tetrahydrodipicolinate synthase
MPSILTLGSPDLEMTEPVFAGVGVPIVTLFRDDGSLDAAATADHGAHLVGLGMGAVVVAGSTGEAASLDRDERVELLRAVRDTVRSVPVIAGTGAPSTRQAVTFTEDARGEGADAVLALTPRGSADARPYYDAIVKAAGDTPVLAYHFPDLSPPGIPVTSLADLNVAGCKDSSGSAERLLAELDACDLPIYVGSSALLALAGPLGCAGAIVALANAEPERCIAAFAGDVATQRELADAHRRSMANFPGGVKKLTAERFGTSAVSRMG